ncbi:MAG: helix-turn-helix domain-containing protein [Bacteroidota bacterium]
MVCIRCKMIVSSELEKLGLEYRNLILGEVDLLENISQEKLDDLDIGLKRFGLELIIDKRAKIIEKIKTIIIEQIHYSEEEVKANFPKLLSQQLNYNYKYLSNLFSEMHGTTIEHFIINQKIERVKELLVYNELNLSEIAWKLNYSSVQHLSNQFKKITGLTPSFFKKMKDKRRSGLNEI